MSSSDPYGLERFIDAQTPIYAQVLSELKDGRKQSHWMWFIFPQLDGLGHTPTTVYYSIKSAAEARAYLAHPLLGPRLLECAELVLDVQGRPVHAIFGSPDDIKLRSCMSLFAFIAGPVSVFARVLEKYYEGKPDPRTLELLGASHAG